MTLRTILRFPDHRLRANAERVIVFDEDLCSLATDLLDTLRAASAIGITAPHIGVLKRLVVIEIADSDRVRTYVNPQIVWASADMIRDTSRRPIRTPCDLRISSAKLRNSTQIQTAHQP